MLPGVPAPTVQLFRAGRIKLSLTRVLYIWAMRHPASSYVQGINDLALPLLVTFLAEESASSTDLGEARKGGCNYDEVLNGTVMESVSDKLLDEVRMNESRH
mgnify:CR=1 FL=1